MEAKEQRSPTEYRPTLIAAGASTVVVLGKTRRLMVWCPWERTLAVMAAAESLGLRFAHGSGNENRAERFLVFNF